MTTYPNLPQRRPVASRLFAVVSLLFALCLVPLLSAQENPGKKTYDIPADDAERALKAFAHQSGLEVLFVTDATKGVRTLAVKGEYTPREALDQLLAGTPLTATQSGPTGAFKVRREKSVELAEKNVASRASRDRAADLNEKKEAVVKLDTFEVFGRKTLNMDIQRTRDDPQPYVVFGREEIELSGASSLPDFLGRRVTSAALVNPPEAGAAGFLGVQQSTIDLRGQGFGQTLILVDGRPLPSQFGMGGNPAQPNLDQIPVNAIERIEILAATASGIYGGGATGGVINVILRRNYAGGTIRLTYGSAFDTDVGLRRGEVNWGATFPGGKGAMNFTASWSDGNSLLQQDRGIRTAGYALILANNPGQLLRASSAAIPRTSAVTNVSTASGNLVLKSAFGGATLPAGFTFIPTGYAGPSSDNGAALAMSAGHYNFQLAANAAGDFEPLWSFPTQQNYRLLLRHDVGTKTEVFVDSSYARSKSERHLAPVVSPFTLAASATGNPFNQAVTVSFPLFGVNALATQKTETVAVTAGAIIRLPSEWMLEADWSGSRNGWAYSTSRNSALNSAALRSAVTSGAVNIFRDLNSYPVDFGPYLTEASGTREYATLSSVWAARASGPVGKWLPNGTLSASAMYRTDEIPDILSTSAGIPQSLTPGRHQSITTAYLELKWPVIQNGKGRPFLQSLEFDLSGRFDQYRTFASVGSVSVDANGAPLAPIPSAVSAVNHSTNPTLSILYRPLKCLALRATHGTGFLAADVGRITPSVPNIFTSPIQLGLTDPFRGNEPVSIINLLAAGNPTLRPEHSTSNTAGIIVNPSAMPGLRIAIDWVKIDKRDAISSFLFRTNSQADFVAAMSAFPDRFVRAAASNGFSVGPIVTIDNSAANIAKQEIEAVDYSLEYQKEFSVGRIRAFVQATNNIRNRNQLALSGGATDSLGVTSFKWQGVGSVEWRNGPWIAAWSTRYFDKYFLNTSHDFDLNQGSATIPSVTYHDFVVKYRMTAGAGMFGSFELGLAVNNILGRTPPIVVNPSTGGAFALRGDPRLANYVLTLAKFF